MISLRTPKKQPLVKTPGNSLLNFAAPSLSLALGAALENGKLSPKSGSKRSRQVRFFGYLVVIPLLWLLASCASTESHSAGLEDVAILASWVGDYPVAALDRLPEDQRDTAHGWLDAVSFPVVWQAFQPEAAVPTIDFANELVVFVRNTDFYNRTRITRITRVDDVAEVLTIETRSALPVKDRVAMALAVIPRAGIKALRMGDRRVSINAHP
jgi:hypothetical protein